MSALKSIYFQLQKQFSIGWTAALFLSLTVLGSCSDEKTEWVDFAYDDAFAFYYDNELSSSMPSHGVVVDGGLNPSIINNPGEKLSRGQLVELSRIMGGQYTEEEIERSDCYVPHHGIVFFLDGKIVADISVCFDCNQVKSNPKSTNVDAEDLRMMFIYHDLPLDPAEFPSRQAKPLDLDSIKSVISG